METLWVKIPAVMYKDELYCLSDENVTCEIPYYSEDGDTFCYYYKGKPTQYVDALLNVETKELIEGILIDSVEKKHDEKYNPGTIIYYTQRGSSDFIIKDEIDRIEYVKKSSEVIDNKEFVDYYQFKHPNVETKDEYLYCISQYEPVYITKKGKSFTNTYSLYLTIEN